MSLILFFVPLAIGGFIIWNAGTSTAKGVSGVVIGMIVLIAMIIGIAAIHPPGDYRHHKTERTSSHHGGGL